MFEYRIAKPGGEEIVLKGLRPLKTVSGDVILMVQDEDVFDLWSCSTTVPPGINQLKQMHEVLFGQEVTVHVLYPATAIRLKLLPMWSPGEIDQLIDILESK